MISPVAKPAPKIPRRPPSVAALEDACGNDQQDRSHPRKAPPDRTGPLSCQAPSPGSTRRSAHVPFSFISTPNCRHRRRHRRGRRRIPAMPGAARFSGEAAAPAGVGALWPGRAGSCASKMRRSSWRNWTERSFDGVDIALFSAGSGVSKQFAPIAVAAGAVVVDNSSAFRMDDAVPLVVPEINADKIATHTGIIANPNCSAIVSITPLWPIHRVNRITRMTIATYQAASGAGAAAMEELTESTRAYLNGEDYAPKVLPHPYAFNLFSHNSAVDPRDRLQRRGNQGHAREAARFSAIRPCASPPPASACRCCAPMPPRFHLNANGRLRRARSARCWRRLRACGWWTTGNATCFRCRGTLRARMTFWWAASVRT